MAEFVAEVGVCGPCAAQRLHAVRQREFDTFGEPQPLEQAQKFEEIGVGLPTP